MNWRPGTQPGLSASRALLRRRGFLLSLRSPAWLLAAGTVPSAQAGRQLEEPLADAVRTALSASIESRAPPVPEFDAAQARDAHERWMSAMGTRLTRQAP